LVLSTHFSFVAVFRLHLAHTLWVPSVARLLRAVPAPLLDAAACVRVAKSVARACRFLHHALPAPVVHGDLTVANVLLTEEGVAKLCDFGLSRTQHQVQ
jgi:serine/threonine protein kinase